MMIWGLLFSDFLPIFCSETHVIVGFNGLWVMVEKNLVSKETSLRSVSKVSTCASQNWAEKV